jgi:thioredoxin-like negative regulator of GroEL
MIEISNILQFNKLMTSTTDLIIIVFTSIWDNKYFKFNLEMEKLELKYKNLIILSVNIDENLEITNAYDIKQVPTTVFYKDNTKTYDDIIGVDKINEIEEIIIKKHHY